ncbi:hypothetical protein HaLaN_32560 [Haematococcus lacustris]|uniref:Uncharacterized protein n=1 Tax=Haematococcus lacustris TaxID=44745 RepID=A0A6A0AKE8_HAELA|nr:hypothetical protein HaLaN_32560 [Haematococcus lacustris]
MPLPSHTMFLDSCRRTLAPTAACTAGAILALCARSTASCAHVRAGPNEAQPELGVVLVHASYNTQSSLAKRNTYHSSRVPQCRSVSLIMRLWVLTPCTAAKDAHIRTGKCERLSRQRIEQLWPVLLNRCALIGGLHRLSRQPLGCLASLHL